MFIGLDTLRPSLRLPQAEIEAFCRKWMISRLEVFGSALREDFGEESDVDLLVTFQAGAGWSLLDLARMENELTDRVGCRVDLVDRAGLERSRNAIRRNEILDTAVPLYAA